MIVVLGGRDIHYTLKWSGRSKRLRLAVYPDGTLVATAPRSLDVPAIENFMRRKSHWVLKKIDHFKSLGKTLLPKSTRADYLACKETALNFVSARVAHFNAFYNFTFKKITIRNQKTRWGSCSKNGTLSFNYKVTVLPKKLADYIVVHELCHLEELNHSPKFWKLVEQTFPDHKGVRKELRGITALV